MFQDTTPRSFAPITQRDLDGLLELARHDQDRVYQKRPDYRGRLLGTVLAQGAAAHYVDRTTGVKDFDVYSIFSRAERLLKWDIQKRHVDFGASVHGRQLYTALDRADSELAKKIPRFESFAGRRVDLMVRDILSRLCSFPPEIIDSDFETRRETGAGDALAWREQLDLLNQSTRLARQSCSM